MKQTQSDPDQYYFPKV